MSFSNDFANCMSSSGLPSPSDVFDALSDALEVLHKLHNAWENAGGDEEMTMVALLALGAAVGIDEAALAALAAAFAEAAAITVTAYLAACLTCVVSATGSAVWNAISSTDDSWLHDQLVAQAEAQDIPNPTAIA